MPQDTVVLNFKLRNETKGAVRYEEIGAVKLIGTLYFRKTVFDGQPFPERLELMVRFIPNGNGK